MSLDSQATSAVIYKQLFTDAEWDAISSALNDYQDYGDEEANIADSIQAKIATIYKLTNWNSLKLLWTKWQLTPLHSVKHLLSLKRSLIQSIAVSLLWKRWQLISCLLSALRVKILKLFIIGLRLKLVRIVLSRMIKSSPLHYTTSDLF